MDSTPKIATIGMFDGVHCGHRFLIHRLEKEAAERNLHPVIFTFSRHPLSLIAPDKEPPHLNGTEEKVLLLEDCGKNEVVVLDFDEKLRNMTARSFLEMLRKSYNVRTLIMGYDHRFGHDKITDREEYVRRGREENIEVLFASPFEDPTPIRINSSYIRKLISDGNIEMANKALGRPYSIEAKVVDGKKIGRKLGFPTANLMLIDNMQLLPAPGVYAVRVQLPDSETFGGMLNIGTRPTIDHSSEPHTTVEVNIINYNGELYGSVLKVSFIARLRGEKNSAPLMNLENNWPSTKLMPLQSYFITSNL